jgi:hypothetical protein
MRLAVVAATISITLLLMLAPAWADESDAPRACFVFGQIFSGPTQTSAILSSNCGVQIERNARSIRMTRTDQAVEFLIPALPGMHEFVYRWGQPRARMGEEMVQISFVRADAMRLP